MTSTGHVFVSHSSDNRELASELAAFLEARGIKVWIAPRDVRPGMDYSEQLQLAIENAIAFVVLVTEMANKSPYVRAETEMAFSTHKPIFPVRLSDIQPAAGLAFFLKIRHWTDAYGSARSDNLDRLTHELQTLTAAHAAPPPAPAPAATPAAPAAPAPAPAATTPPRTDTSPPGAATPLGVTSAVAAPPPPRPALPAAPATPEEEEKWRAAVGPKADLYLERWKQMAERRTIFRWSWAACLANLFWFAYRKMWVPAAAVGFLYLLNIAFVSNPQASGVTGLLSLAATFVTGAFGTHLYRQQTARLVAATSGQEPAAALETLRKRGGVSLPALYGAIGFVVVLVLIAGAILARRPPVTVAPDPFNTLGPSDPFNNVEPTLPPNTGDKPVGTDEPMPEPEPEPEPEPPPEYQDNY